MKLAAISDIHGNLGALEAVLADIRARGADLIVNLGDILSGPLMPPQTADLLMSLNLPTIRGNHERQLLETEPAKMGPSDRHAHQTLRPEHMAWIASLPATLRLSDEIFLCHGTPTSDLKYFLETADEAGIRPATREEAGTRAGDVRAEIILCGHTHTPRATRLADGRLVVNAGSVGLQAYDWDVPVPHKIQNGTPHARYVIIEKKPAGWQVETVAVAYDWECAAQLADKNNRPDWAIALRTGYR
jgi:predicted phosphodiesterase